MPIPVVISDSKRTRAGLPIPVVIANGAPAMDVWTDTGKKFGERKVWTRQFTGTPADSVTLVSGLHNTFYPVACGGSFEINSSGGELMFALFGTSFAHPQDASQTVRSGVYLNEASVGNESIIALFEGYEPQSDYDIWVEITTTDDLPPE
jgi:hypothetical protein